ncbi:MAG: DUF3068 domain-containing protein [Micromonosporaceae bacterium]|nr:DUF3068 domain-containing protein [Micromonosporaceae bacterium]
MRTSGEEVPDRPRDVEVESSDAGSSHPGRTAAEAREAQEPREATEPRTARGQAQLAGPGREPSGPPPRARRRLRWWPIPLALLGLAAFAAAAILAWSVAPDRTQLPKDYAATRDITGTVHALLSQPALESGNIAGALVTNVPVTGQRTVRVVSTSGGAAQVQEERVLAVDGQPIGSGSATYAVDRLSLEPAASVPADWTVDPHEGLTVAFPVNADRRDYSIWIPDMQTTAPLRFVREESREGVNTYVYQVDVPETPIHNPTVLSTLPSSLSRSALEGMLPMLPIPEEQRAILAQAVPGLPDQVPIRYTYQAGSTYWVEPTTGTIVDIHQQVVRTGTVAGPGGAMLATLPVYNVDTRFADASVAAAVREANDRRDGLTAISSTWPWILVALGAVALLVALLGLLVRRRPPRRPVPPPSYRPTERTTRVDVDAARRAEAWRQANAGRPADAQRRAGQPQPPYAGQSPHTEPYRETPAGQTTGEPDREPGRIPRHGPGQPPPGTPEP